MPDDFVDVGMEQTILNVLAITAVAWSVLPSDRLSRTVESKLTRRGKRRAQERAMMAEARRLSPEAQRASREARPC